MAVIKDWFVGQKPHFGAPKSQRLLRDRWKRWEQVTPSKPCEIPGDMHVCGNDWCMRRSQ